MSDRQTPFRVTPAAVEAPDGAAEPRPGNPRVGIVVLNYANPDDTANCLASLQRVSYSPLEICVVDNWSSDECVRTLERTLHDHPDVLFIRNPTNLGYAAGNNVGIRALLARGAEYVLVLNNDTLVSPDFLQPLVGAMEADERAGVAMPRFFDETGADVTPIRRRPTYWSYYGRFGAAAAIRRRRLRRSGAAPAAPPAYTSGTVPIEIPSGACMLLRSRFLREIGLLDEGTFLYQEEPILAEQVRRLNRTMLLVPASTVVHLGGRSTRNFKLRRTLAMWRSQNYYLRRYRGVGPLRRWLLIGYQSASFAGIGALRLLRKALWPRARR